MTTRLEMPGGQRLGAWVKDPHGEIGYITGFYGSDVHVVFPELGHIVEICDLAELTLVDRPRVDLPGVGEPAGHWEYEALTLSTRDGSVIGGGSFGDASEACAAFVRDTPHTAMRRRWVTDWEQVEP
ncbi:hypothetical protein [Corynebacterium sp. TAE3-ERU16]|uniref:hypothetical protein n=1 Tax=Corynebacterium sp. TAE3-ERU16 TaxID=2849493 RepID=UPI001C44DDCB|nr:hypothetical protein [Corynebacterium sp. TAE3-ERU16]MBV7292346.1 hypothetical protein [Corynebacterium sp. TAE3-ERU16]